MVLAQPRKGKLEPEQLEEAIVSSVTGMLRSGYAKLFSWQLVWHLRRWLGLRSHIASCPPFSQVDSVLWKNVSLSYSRCPWAYWRPRQCFREENCLTLLNLVFSKLIWLPFFFLNLFALPPFFFMRHLLIYWGLHIGELFSDLCRYFSLDKVEQRRNWLEGW